MRHSLTLWIVALGMLLLGYLLGLKTPDIHAQPPLHPDGQVETSCEHTQSGQPGLRWQTTDVCLTRSLPRR